MIDATDASYHPMGGDATGECHTFVKKIPLRINHPPGGSPGWGCDESHRRTTQRVVESPLTVVNFSREGTMQVVIDSSALVSLADWDVILVNTSAGKDSSVMAHQVVELARAAGVEDRVRFVHATFGEEWAGTEQLARRQVAALGDFPLDVVHRDVEGTENILDYALARGAFPSSKARYCTSEFKRAPIAKVITRLERQGRDAGPLRVLNCLGMRAAESPAR